MTPSRMSSHRSRHSSILVTDADLNSADGSAYLNLGSVVGEHRSIASLVGRLRRSAAEGHIPDRRC
jgi:hypothetical protein